MRESVSVRVFRAKNNDIKGIDALTAVASDANKNMNISNIFFKPDVVNLLTLLNSRNL